MKELRKLDFSKDKYFTCGGKKYYVMESISFVRYRELQKLSLEFAFSATFIDIFNNLKKSIDAFNGHKYDEMVVIIHNIMNGIIRIEDKDPPAIRVCTLFINEENEDPSIYSDAMMKEKVDIWNKELDMLPFFLSGYQFGERLDASLRETNPQWFKDGGTYKIRPIDNEIKELEKYWKDLIYTICKGEPAKMRELVKMDIHEFFNYVDNFKENLKQE